MLGETALAVLGSALFPTSCPPPADFRSMLASSQLDLSFSSCHSPGTFWSFWSSLTREWASLAWLGENVVGVEVDCDEARDIGGPSADLALTAGTKGFGSEKSRAGTELRTVAPRAVNGSLTLWLMDLTVQVLIPPSLWHTLP